MCKSSSKSANSTTFLPLQFHGETFRQSCIDTRNHTAQALLSPSKPVNQSELYL